MFSGCKHLFLRCLYSYEFEHKIRSLFVQMGLMIIREAGSGQIDLRTSRLCSQN